MDSHTILKQKNIGFIRKKREVHKTYRFSEEIILRYF